MRDKSSREEVKSWLVHIHIFSHTVAEGGGGTDSRARSPRVPNFYGHNQTQGADLRQKLRGCWEDPEKTLDVIRASGLLI